MRIIGGRFTTINEFPSLVAIQFEGRQWCGGTLITHEHVLTAAHCVVVQQSYERPYDRIGRAAEFFLYAGSTKSSSFNSPLRVEKVHVHERYTGLVRTNYRNDIAILKVC